MRDSLREDVGSGRVTVGDIEDLHTYAAKAAIDTLKPRTEREREWAIEAGRELAFAICARCPDGESAARELRCCFRRELIDTFRRRPDVTRRSDGTTTLHTPTGLAQEHPDPVSGTEPGGLVAPDFSAKADLSADVFRILETSRKSDPLADPAVSGKLRALMPPYLGVPSWRPPPPQQRQDFYDAHPERGWSTLLDGSDAG
jgi:hypothetical protein